MNRHQPVKRLQKRNGTSGANGAVAIPGFKREANRGDPR